MIIFAVVAAFFARLLSLGLYPLTDPSEGRYADIGRRIVEYGDWVTPWIDQGVPFWGKPPLSFWMTGASLQTLGESAFAARLPHFIAGALILWIVYDLFKRAGLAKAGIYSLAITAGSVIFYVSSGTVMTDAALVVGCTLTMRGFWLSVNGEPGRRHKECYLAFVGLAIGLLAKGPLVLVLSLIPIGLWTIYSRNLKTVFVDLPWIRGVLLMLAIALPWYIVAELRTPGFLEYFIVGEHWQRYLQKDWAGDLYGKGHGKALGMIWVYALISLLPWTILLPVLAWITRRAPRSDSIKPQHQMMVYFAIWGLFPLVFFSLSSNVLIAYTLPTVAPLACLAGLWLAQRQADKAIGRTLIGGVIFTTALSFGAVGYILLTDEHKKISTEALVQTWHASAQNSEPLYFYLWVPQSSKFYTAGQAGLFKDTEQLERTINAGKPMFLALYDSQLRAMPESLRSQLKNPKAFGRYTLFEINR
ncbi:MAG: glycosyltransferase family 39 protein [Burkholderiaceae bacterium]|nr:glycosyltransferase family 39 protein [Burkholderiaceae bacterium]MCD8518165.1 glycosyltransferase family 39 protein [Burkholderiaceae bacterium]MCD8564169.1 glycosyltransferase family 39 protein [Burkholderiaceae bacterium]